MLVLGLESSCDETAAAVVENGHHVHSDIVTSQIDVHARYGGVVPELASRAHILHIVPVIDEALSAAKVSLEDIDGIAVTQGPGLIGALLVALQTAKAIAYARSLPLVGVHHLEGHVSAIRLEEEYPPYPHIAVVISGGHSSFLRVDGPGNLVELGATRDDAAGEAFDKIGKLLGLGYPGGVAVDRLAMTGDETAVPMPRLMTKKSTGLDLSFSGLKTAVLNFVKKSECVEGKVLADLCASFQATVVEVLVRKTRIAVQQERLMHVQLCGGVAANSGIRAGLRRAGEEDGFKVYIPPPKRCTDNAAMIAAAGEYYLARGVTEGPELNANSGLPLPGPAAETLGLATDKRAR